MKVKVPRGLFRLLIRKLKGAPKAALLKRAHRVPRPLEAQSPWVLQPDSGLTLVFCSVKPWVWRLAV